MWKYLIKEYVNKTKKLTKHSVPTFRTQQYLIFSATDTSVCPQKVIYDYSMI